MSKMIFPIWKWLLGLFKSKPCNASTNKTTQTMSGNTINSKGDVTLVQNIYPSATDTQKEPRRKPSLKQPRRSEEVDNYLDLN